MSNFICPEAEYHGNPFRYCGVKGCGWMEDTPPNNIFPYTNERIDEIIQQANEWADAFWNGTHSPHGDHGPIISIISLAEAYRAVRTTS